MPATSTLLKNATTIRQTLWNVSLGVLGWFAILSVRGTINGIFGPQDEGILLVYPDLILRGYIPYKDFAALYPPADIYLLAGIYRLFGESISIERSLGAAYWFLIVTGTYLIGLRVNRITAIFAGISALAYLSLLPYLGSHTHFGALVCILFSLVVASTDWHDSEQSARRVVFLAGAIAGTTFWFKQDLGVIAIVATLISVDPFSYRRLWTYVSGAALPACAMVVFGVLTGPVEVFDSLILDPYRSAPGRYLPVYLSWEFLVIAVCVTLQCIAAVGMYRSKLPRHLLRLSRGSAVLCLGYSLSLLHRTGSGDIGLQGLLVVPLTLVSGAIFLLGRGVSGRMSMTAIVALFVVALLPAAVQHQLAGRAAHVRYGWVIAGERSAPVPVVTGSERSDLQSLVDELGKWSRAGERLFVGPNDLRFANYNDTYIYYLLPQLQPASRYLEMNPGCANRPGSGLTAQISAADWLILMTSYDNWREPNASGIPGPTEPNTLVRTNFCLRSQYGPWTLLHRCSSNGG